MHLEREIVRIVYEALLVRRKLESGGNFWIRKPPRGKIQMNWQPGQRKTEKPEVELMPWHKKNHLPYVRLERENVRIVYEALLVRRKLKSGGDF